METTSLPINKLQSLASANKEPDVSSRSKSCGSAEDYLSAIHSPKTKRKNAAMFLRSVSEEVNNMKFSDIISDHKKTCPPHRRKKFYSWHWRVVVDSIIFLHRLKAGVSQRSEDSEEENDGS